MNSISSVGAAFGYTNAVLAYDDTLPAAPAASTPPPASTPTTMTPLPMVATTAQKVELGNLALESQIATALFASALTGTGSSSVFFSGAAMTGLLNNQGSAAMSYLTPQAAPTVGSLFTASA